MFKTYSPSNIGGIKPTAKRRLVSAEALFKLERTINRVLGGGLPPGWDLDAAKLEGDYDWIVLQAEFLLRTRLPYSGPDRYYGLEIGDLVAEMGFGTSNDTSRAVKGIVTKYHPTDNNCVYLRLPDGSEHKAVAEYCKVLKRKTP